MASSPFERQVVEGDLVEEERESLTVDSENGPRQFEPSPSFLDYDRPSVRLVELPAWLQSFASTVGEPSGAEPPAVLERSPLEQPVSSSSDRQPARNEPRPKSSGQPPPDSGSNFISEDDLPEWLRAIAPDDGPESGRDHLTSSMPFDADGDDREITVPSVSRAWSTTKDSRGVDEATTLFSQLASQASQSTLTEYELDPASNWDLGESTAMADEDEFDEFTETSPSAEVGASLEIEQESAQSKKPFPLLPIAVAAVLLIVLVGAAFVLFL